MQGIGESCAAQQCPLGRGGGCASEDSQFEVMPGRSRREVLTCRLLYNLMLCWFVLCRYAVGTRGWLTFQGRWAWWLKDYIDRSFMNKYGKDLQMDDTVTLTAGN